MIKAIVFDLDGTLLDTLEDLSKSVNFALKTLQFPTISLNQTRLYIGNGTSMLMKRAMPKDINEETYNEGFKLFSEHYNIHYNDCTHPYENIDKLLVKLKDDGYKLGVLSNKLDDKAKLLIEKHLPNLFDAVQGTYLNLPKKPDPIITKMPLKTLDVLPSEALYIGDTEVDEECAKLGGMYFLLVGYGYRTVKELEVKCPNYRPVTKISDLYSKIKHESSLHN